MPQWRMVTSSFTVNVFGNDNTSYLAPVGAIETDGATEVEAQIRARDAYSAWENLYVYIGLNSLSTTPSVTIRTRINGANGSASISAGASATGRFEDTTGTDSVSSGDLMAYQVVTDGSHGQSCNISQISTTLAATADRPILGSASPTGAVVPFLSTRYVVIGGSLTVPDVTESFSQYRFRTSSTLRNLRTYITSESINGSITLRTRVNGSNGGMSVSISGTGEFEDTTGSDTISAGDLLGLQFVTAGSMGDVTPTIIHMESESVARQTTIGDDENHLGAVRYEALEGHDQNTGFEPEAETTMRFSNNMRNLFVRVTSYSLDLPATVALRKNRVNTALSVSVNGTGEFEDLVDTISFADTDEANYIIDRTGATGSLFTRYIGVEQLVSAGLALVKAVASTVNISESPASILGLIKAAASTIQVSEGVPRLMAMVKAVASTVNVSETTPRLMAMVRQVSSTVSLSEALARPLTMVRAVASTLQISEAAASIIGLIKNVPDTLNISEGTAKLLGLIRQVASTVNVSEALARRMAMVRIQSSTVNISEGVPRRMSMARAVASTVQVSEGTPRLMSMVRAVASTVNISEATARLGGLVRQVASTVNISEAAAPIIGLIKNVPDTLQIGEATARFMAMVRAIASTVQVSEGTPRLMSMVRAAASTVQISETAPRLMGMVRSVASTVQIGEALTRLIGLVRSVSSTVQVSEALSRRMAMVRAIAETVQIRGAVVSVHDAFTDTDGTLLEAHTPDIDAVGNGWDVVSMAAAEFKMSGNRLWINLNSIGFGSMAIIDSGMADCVITAKVEIAGNHTPVYFRVDADAAAPVENAWFMLMSISNLSLRLFKIVNGTYFVLDTVPFTYTTGMQLEVEITLSGDSIICKDLTNNLTVSNTGDFFQVTETHHGLGELQGVFAVYFDDFHVEVPGSVVRFMAMVRAVSSTVQVSEATARASALVRSIASTVQIGESVTAARGLVRSVSETVQVSEGVAWVRGLVRAVNETVQIAESAARSLTALIEAVGERFARFVRRERSVRGDDDERDVGGPSDERGVR